jgi:hypothetical protein
MVRRDAVWLITVRQVRWGGAAYGLVGYGKVRQVG